MTLPELKDKKVAVLGLGIEGIALVGFLADKVGSLAVLDKGNKDLIVGQADPAITPKIEEIIADERIIKTFGEEYLDHLFNYDVIFRSPGISARNPKIREAEKQGVEISSQIKLFFDLCPSTIIGVTGTKGKGTTASLIYSILKRKSQILADKFQTSGKREVSVTKVPQVYLAGNIGYPALTLLNEISEGDVAVLELSSFQLMDLQKSPHIAVVTNLDIEHQDYHQDIEEYQRAKFNIIAHQEPGDFAVLNQNSTFSKQWLESPPSDITYFSSSETAEAEAFIRQEKDGLAVVLKADVKEIIVCRQSEIKLIGRHNLENIAAAALAVWAVSSDRIDILEESFRAVNGFEGLPHRLELVAEVGDIKYIDDSFGTTPGPTIAAIDSLPEDKVLILGGSSKGADFSQLAQKIASANVRGVVVIGAEGPRIKSVLEKERYGGVIIDGGETIDGIVERAKQIAKPGDAVILSPACASFGLFKNYKDRGERFKKAVLELIE